MDLVLRTTLRRLAGWLQERVLKRFHHGVDRLTRAYHGAITLIELFTAESVPQIKALGNVGISGPSEASPRL